MNYEERVKSCIRSFERYEFERMRNKNRLLGGIPISYKHQDICREIAIRQYNMLVGEGSAIRDITEGFRLVQEWRRGFLFSAI